MERVLIVVGVGMVGLGIAAMAVPSVASLVGGADAFVSLLGVLALVQAVRAASDFWSVSRDTAELPDAHGVDSASVVGATLDRALELSGRRGAIGRRNRAQVKRHLRDVAVEVLVAELGDSPDEIRATLDEGTWTDDPVAAALFAEESDAGWRDRIRSLLGRDTTFQRRVQRAVAALERRGEERARE
jgi:hypothetical protein